jgi:hypothetical protein
MKTPLRIRTRARELLLETSGLMNHAGTRRRRGSDPEGCPPYEKRVPGVNANQWAWKLTGVPIEVRPVLVYSLAVPEAQTRPGMAIPARRPWDPAEQHQTGRELHDGVPAFHR